MRKNLADKKTAEILSFLISTGIIIGLLIYLGVEHFRSTDSPYLELKTTLMKDAVKQVGDKFLIPIKIENLSDKTPAKAIFLINVISNGTNESHPFEIEYLSRHSAKVMYWSYDKDPSELEIKIELKSYQF